MANVVIVGADRGIGAGFKSASPHGERGTCEGQRLGQGGASSQTQDGARQLHLDLRRHSHRDISEFEESPSGKRREQAEDQGLDSPDKEPQKQNGQRRQVQTCQKHENGNHHLLAEDITE